MGFFQRTWNRLKSAVSSIFTRIYNFFAGIFSWFGNKIFPPPPSKFSAHKTMIISCSNDMLRPETEYAKTHILSTMYAMLQSLVTGNKGDPSFVSSANLDLMRLGIIRMDGKEIDNKIIEKNNALDEFSNRIANTYPNTWVNKDAIKNAIEYVYCQGSQAPFEYLFFSLKHDNQKFIESNIRFSDKNNKITECRAQRLDYYYHDKDPHSLLTTAPGLNNLNTNRYLEINGNVITYTDESFKVLDVNDPSNAGTKYYNMQEELSKLSYEDLQNTEKVIKHLQEKNVPISLRYKYQMRVDFDKLDPNSPGKFLPNNRAIVQTLTLKAIDPDLKIMAHEDLNPYLQQPANLAATESAPFATPQQADVAPAAKSGFSERVRKFMHVGSYANATRPENTTVKNNNSKPTYKKE